MRSTRTLELYASGVRAGAMDPSAVCTLPPARATSGIRHFRVADVIVDSDWGVLTRNAKRAVLSPSELLLFRACADRDGSIVSYDALVDRLWSTPDGGPLDPMRVLRVHACRLNRKLASIGARIRVKARSGVGYGITTASGVS